MTIDIRKRKYLYVCVSV